jgi:hypothetical protein
MPRDYSYLIVIGLDVFLSMFYFLKWARLKGIMDQRRLAGSGRPHFNWVGLRRIGPIGYRSVQYIYIYIYGGEEREDTTHLKP